MVDRHQGRVNRDALVSPTATMRRGSPHMESKDAIHQVVFVLAGMGASVTSVDVAQQQLDIAQRRAREFGLAVEFVRADVTDLAAFANNSFDVVYTGGHVTVWVADLSSYYLAPTAIGRRDAAQRAVLETQRVRTQPAIDHARNGRTAVADCVGSPMSPSRW